jgi:hypothetical protein
VNTVPGVIDSIVRPFQQGARQPLGWIALAAKAYPA